MCRDFILFKKIDRSFDEDVVRSETCCGREKWKRSPITWSAARASRTRAVGWCHMRGSITAIYIIHIANVYRNSSIGLGSLFLTFELKHWASRSSWRLSQPLTWEERDYIMKSWIQYPHRLSSDLLALWCGVIRIDIKQSLIMNPITLSCRNKIEYIEASTTTNVPHI